MGHHETRLENEFVMPRFESHCAQLHPQTSVVDNLKMFLGVCFFFFYSVGLQQFVVVDFSRLFFIDNFLCLRFINEHVLLPVSLRLLPSLARIREIWSASVGATTVGS